jgi:cation transport regulator ChaB
VSDCPFTLPPEGQRIYAEVFDAAKMRRESDDRAARQAWRVVKMTYRKKNGGWVLRKPKRTLHAARGRLIKI